jgi:hypothetical protein
MIARFVFCIAIATSALVVATPVDGPRALVASKLDTMATLVGTWRPAGKGASPLRIRFSLTAGGTVLVEEWTRAGRPHSLTLYHRDGKGLIATHYCPQGNQPRLQLVSPIDEKVLRFAFRDATDLDAEHEAFLTALTFDLSDPALVVRRETYRQKGVDEASELKLVRH